MRLAGPGDGRLLAGMAIALMVLVARPIHHIFDLSRGAEQTLGLSLVPAFVVLAVTWLLHRQARWFEAKAAGSRAQARAEQARACAASVDRLVEFEHALSAPADFDAIRDRAAHHLPQLAGSDDVWVLVRSRRGWHALTGTRHLDPGGVSERYRDIAQKVVTHATTSVAPIVVDGHWCVPIVSGSERIGVLGVPEATSPITNARARVLAAAANLIGIALQTVALQRNLRQRTLRDELTGCFVRTHALGVMATELRRARRTHAPVSVILFEVDHLRSIVNRYGADGTDAVLAAVGERLHRLLRGSDLKCRSGAGEFLLLLPDTPLEGARRVADTLRREIAALHPISDADVLVTASFGVTAAAPAEIDAQPLLARARVALDRAKDQGTNCVRLLAETAVA